ncbi:MAG: 2-isopropylmalate synthase [Planctomycetes bacterium]|nr:2-isopropylmalate synthase [Planctomycetota bacterium]
MPVRRIEIFDTTLRDGEQVPGAKLNPEQKLEVAKQLARLNVDVIEAGFPISSPGDLDAVRQVARTVHGPVIAGLARALKPDIEAAWEAVRDADRPRIHTFLSTSDIHIERQFRKTRKQVLEMAVEAVQRAKALTDDVEYSAMDATRSDVDYLCETIERVIEAGATVVNIPDTVGYAVPDEYGALIARIIARVPNIGRTKLSVHCHNDLGLASANSLAAVRNGVTQVECTINGIGERAGNASLEEIVMTIRTRRDLFNAETRIRHAEIARTSRMVSSLMGIPVQPNKAIVGSNAFAHSSGIHQDGILKDRQTYEIIRPEDVGIEEHRFVLTARSGRHALSHRLKAIGYEASDADLDVIYQRFKEIADRKKEVTNEDLEAIVSDKMAAAPETFHLEHLKAIADSRGTPSATVGVRVGSNLVEQSATGDGPVDAAFRAIDKITRLPLKLTDYSVRAVSRGKEAVGEVTLKAESPHGVVSARASATDIIEASARAYVSAVNKAIAAKGSR